MGKFIIECPKCGAVNSASSSIFARNVVCSCGEKFSISDNRLITKQCNFCGENVVLDQKKGENATCPSCNKKINTIDIRSKSVDIICPQCSSNLIVNKDVNTHICQICDHEIDVKKEIGRSKLVTDNSISVIKYEGDNKTFVWKHPIEDFNMGSQLIVHESQEALFFYNGQALDLFPSGRYTLETQKLPMVSRLYKLPTEPKGVQTFHSEVYFINMSVQMGIKWGTDSRVRFFEPATGIHTDIGACGEFNLRVTDSRKLILKLVGTAGNLTQEEAAEKSGNNKSIMGIFRGMIMTSVKTHLAKTIKEQNINILEVDERLEELSVALQGNINKYLDEYGLTMPQFFVTTISTPDDDVNFKRMRQQYADKHLKVKEEEIGKSVAQAAAERKIVEAQTTAQLEIIGAQGKAEAYRLQAEAEAKEMQMKGYTYTQETARQVGVAAVSNESLGGLGGNGGGIIGNMMGVGIGLGAMSGVVDMTKNALNPVDGISNAMKGTISQAANTWDCECGEKGNTKNFCSNCGKTKPVNNTWNCECGEKNNTKNFCANCGKSRPVNITWDCDCGEKGNTKKFCSNCGKVKTSNTWDCDCGEKGITKIFCGNCGKQRRD